jgi:hypothetical protein
MTDEVATLVLRDNYEQNILLGNARAQSHSMLPVHSGSSARWRRPASSTGRWSSCRVTR